MKKTSVLALCMAVLLAVSGCAQQVTAAQTQDTTTTLPVTVVTQPAIPTQALIYFGTEKLEQQVAEIGTLSAQNLAMALQGQPGMPESLTVLGFEEAQDGLHLDLGEGFSAAMSRAAQPQLMLAALVNTYLKAYAAEKLYLSENGQLLQEEPFVFLERFEPETQTAEAASSSSLEAVKLLAFTFDDGPHSSLTRMFVDKLKEYGGVGTFFEVGNRMTGKAAEGVRYASENGCEIAIHGYTHDYNYKKCSEENYQREIEDTRKAIVEVTGIEPTLMRPIGGNITQERVEASPYAVIIWNVDSNDWRYKSRDNAQENIQTIVGNIMGSVHPGSILLMHEIYQNSYEAFCIAIEKLADQGYQFVTVSQLLAGQLEPGRQYYDASGKKRK